ncbi:MAG TPA: hypothetical protein VH042_05170 [Solirubrobacterales bacterium]|jgi:hypothetical protein|nr:hypothetical protein [Solirubrobacterales bacterium]
MSLDGLRAWIGLVERKLTMRTRVFLVLVAIAIGGAGAGIVLAIDAQDNAVTKSDLQSVRDELAGTNAPAEASDNVSLEAEIKTLKSEVAALRGESKGGSNETGSTGGAAAPPDSQQLKEAGEEAIERSEGKGSK